jgi:FAD/FMN-containing dehydrogenase
VSVADLLLDALVGAVGAKRVLTGAATGPYLIDERRRFQGEAVAVVQPADTAEVAAIVTICGSFGRPVVPQGGNTGLCGGATPASLPGAVVVSLERLRRVHTVDAANYTITAGAGLPVAELAEAARSADRLFPLRFGADGTAQIGGALSTNAGGMSVLRYGSARELTLGVEVVLADGRVFSDLAGLRKDNTGYSLTDLFIGAEGTLGIIAAATLRLYPLPAQRITALVATPSIDASVQLLGQLRDATDDRLDAFEWMGINSLSLLDAPLPLPRIDSDLVLLEVSSGSPGEALSSLLESELTIAIETGLAQDAALANSVAEREAFWAIREGLPQAEKSAGGSIKHDIAVQISDVSAMVESALAAVESVAPGCQVSSFGHLGDGNIHFNVVGCPQGNEAEVTTAIFDVVGSLGGSFSAEHGVGRLRREELALRKGPIDLELMGAVKAALDPQGIMNPGAVL